MLRRTSTSSSFRCYSKAPSGAVGGGYGSSSTTIGRMMLKTTQQLAMRQTTSVITTTRTFPKCILKTRTSPSSASLLQRLQAEQRLKSTITAKDASASSLAATRSTTAATSVSSTSATSPAASTTTQRSNVLPWHIVTSPKVVKSLPIIGNGAYLALVSGFLMTDMLTLRLALVGGYTGLVVFHSLHQAPLRIPLRWSALFVFVNVGAATLLILDQYGTPMDDEMERLHNKYFQQQLSRGQFSTLRKLGELEHLEEDYVLTEEGEMSNKLYFLIKGQAKVYHNDKHAADIEEGSFIEDMAFQHRLQNITSSVASNSDDEERDSSISDDDNNDNDNMLGAYGTVVTNDDCTVMVWDQNRLLETLKNNREFVKNIRHLLSDNLMKKLLKQREARHAQENALKQNQILLLRAKTKHQLLVDLGKRGNDNTKNE